MKTESQLLHLYSTLLLPFFFLLLHISSSDTSFYDLNIDCAPHPDILATDGASFRFIPYYVQLNRCQGKNIWGEATADICYPTRIDKVKFEAEDRYSPGTIRDITMENHTECVFGCPRNETFCWANQTWNPATCSCCSRRDDTVCAENSRWSEEYCSCVAEKNVKVEVEESFIKSFTEPKGIKVKYIIVIVVAELIILTPVSFFFAFLCCRMWSKDRERKKREKQDLVRYDDRDTTSPRSTIVTNGSSVTNNRDSFTYNVDKDQRKFVVSGGHGNFVATIAH